MYLVQHQHMETDMKAYTDLAIAKAQAKALAEPAGKTRRERVADELEAERTGASVWSHKEQEGIKS